MAELKVVLVAADRMVWEGQATQVSARGVSGELGILPRHEPMMTALAPGEIRIATSGGTQTAQVDGGFLTVDQDVVTIVAENIRTADNAGTTRR